MMKELLNQEKSIIAMCKFLLWLFGALIVTFIGISNVCAETYDAYLFNAQLYDNVNGSLSTVTTNFSNNYWTGTIPYMGTADSGAAWGISSPIPLIENHTYSMTVFVSHECGNTVLSSYNRIGVGSSFNEAKTSYQNNSNVNENLSKVQSLLYGQGLQFAFTTSVNANYIVFPFATSLSCNNVKFDLNNITIEDLGSSGVSETTINNSLSNQTNNINSNSNNNRDMILNNQASNTQSIIDNQSSTTQAIIDSSSSNTQAMIDSQNNLLGVDCTNLYNHNSITNNNVLTSSGSIISSYGYLVSDYIPVTPNTLYYLSYFFDITINNDNVIRIGFYDTSKTFIERINYSSSTSILTSNNVYYIRLSFQYVSNSKVMFSNKTSTYCEYGSYTSKLDNVEGSINNLNDSINNSNVDDNDISNAFDDFNNFLDDNSTITQLITLPITLYTAILNNLNVSCSPFNLGKLFGADLILPCINISQYLGNSLWTMIDIIISGFAIYSISKKMIKVFNNFSSLREGDVIDD